MSERRTDGSKGGEAVPNKRTKQTNRDTTLLRPHVLLEHALMHTDGDVDDSSARTLAATRNPSSVDSPGLQVEANSSQGVGSAAASLALRH